jgi:hypothetical protein
VTPLPVSSLTITAMKSDDKSHPNAPENPRPLETNGPISIEETKRYIAGGPILFRFSVVSRIFPLPRNVLGRPLLTKTPAPTNDNKPNP